MPCQPLREAVFLTEPTPMSHRQLPTPLDAVPAEAQGVLFLCPGRSCEHSVLIWFANPIGPPGTPVADPRCEPKGRWTRTGDTLATLTLSPSISMSCWHGWVRRGQAEEA